MYKGWLTIFFIHIKKKCGHTIYIRLNIHLFLLLGRGSVNSNHNCVVSLIGLQGDLEIKSANQLTLV